MGLLLNAPMTSVKSLIVCFKGAQAIYLSIVSSSMTPNEVSKRDEHKGDLNKLITIILYVMECADL